MKGKNKNWNWCFFGKETNFRRCGWRYVDGGRWIEYYRQYEKLGDKMLGWDGVIVLEMGMKFNNENKIFEFFKRYA